MRYWVIVADSRAGARRYPAERDLSDIRVRTPRSGKAKQEATSRDDARIRSIDFVSLARHLPKGRPA